MNNTITVNLARMFAGHGPYDCSNNAATLGDQCARLTWESALSVAAAHRAWLESPLADACEDMRKWASGCGAWDAPEIAAWTDVECLALLVQNIASELRMLGSDDSDLPKCVRKYQRTDWDKESEYPVGSYYIRKRTPKCDWYAGI